MDPHDIPLTFIPFTACWWALPLSCAVALLAVPRPGMGCTKPVFISALEFGYEWSQYLIESDYEPKTRPYRAIWRNHRNHHYNNEHC